MYILIDVNGTPYELPLTGETLEIEYTTTSGVDLRFTGLSSPHSGHVTNTVAEIRRQRIYALVPLPPEFVTVSDICDRLPDVSDATVRRALQMLQEQGKVRSTRPRSTHRGQNARRWFRVTP